MIDSTIRHAKILIVDDKASNIDILEGLLEERGYTRFQHTTDSRKVRELFESFRPDIILLDLMMPYLNGYEVMDQLAPLIPSAEYLPILVLTADITPETKRKALSSGARDFLSKPFDLEEVGLRIHNLLETRFLYQQLETHNQQLEEKVKERTLTLEKTNTALDLAHKELAVLNQAKNDFLNLISHEIRTPLNGIRGFTYLLKEEIVAPELLEYLDYLEKSVIRLEEFSYQALLITELHARKYAMEVVPLLVDEMITGATTRLHEKAQAKAITFSFHPESNRLTIHGDTELIRIGLERILDNAIKYSPAHSSIGITLYTLGQTIVCEFSDTGPGFPRKVLDNPFIVFGLGEKHVDQNTGLNLALVKLIMDAHQGQIELSNQPSGGAIVRLTFPSQT